MKNLYLRMAVLLWKLENGSLIMRTLEWRSNYESLRMEVYWWIPENGGILMNIWEWRYIDEYLRMEVGRKSSAISPGWCWSLYFKDLSLLSTSTLTLNKNNYLGFSNLLIQIKPPIRFDKNCFVRWNIWKYSLKKKWKMGHQKPIFFILLDTFQPKNHLSPIKRKTPKMFLELRATICNFSKGGGGNAFLGKNIHPCLSFKIL